MSVVVTRFSNDKSAYPRTLLKLESKRVILMDQANKFQDSRFKENM